MPNATRSRNTDTASPGGTLLEELAREVLALRAEMADLRQQLSSEVRTRRVVVVNENGFESIVASVEGSIAMVKVVSEEDPSVWTGLEASDEDGVSAGLYLSGGDNGLGMLSVYKAEQHLGTKDEVVSYDARLDLMEDHGPSVCLTNDGLTFDR